MSDIDEDVFRANTRNQAGTFSGKWHSFWSNLPRRIQRFGPDVLGIAFVLGVLVWEIRNSTLGFVQLYNPGFVMALAAGTGCCFGSIWFFRIFSENIREFEKVDENGNKTKNLTLLSFITSIFPLFGTLGMMLVVLVGVWANLAAANVNAGEDKIASRNERAAIVSSIRSLERKVSAFSPPIGYEADKIALENLLSMARRNEMENIKPGGDSQCNEDLGPIRRNICTQAAVIYQDLAISEALIEVHTADKLELENKRIELINFVDVESGAEHYEEMASMLGGDVSWKAVGNWVVLLLSGILLICVAFAADHLLEKRERDV